MKTLNKSKTLIPEGVAMVNDINDKNNPLFIEDEGDYFCAVVLCRAVGGYDLRDLDPTQPLLPGWSVLMRSANMEILLIKQLWLKKIQKKLFGGGRMIMVKDGVDILDKNPYTTIFREGLEEVWLKLPQSAIRFYYTDTRNGVKRYFVLANYSDCEGKVRDRELVPGDTGYDPELVGVPEWIPVSEVLKEIHDAHQLPLRKLLLSSEYSELIQPWLFQLESE